MPVRAILKFVIALLTLYALIESADAQVTFGRGRTDTGVKPKNVRGVVQDLRGSPLPGARVFARNTKTNLTRTTSTDGNGFYSITGLPPDADHEITVDFKGQTSDKKFVSSFLNREDNVLNFELDVAVVAGSSAASPSVSSGSSLQLDTFDLVKLHASFEAPTGLPAPIPAVLLLHGYGEDRFVWDAFRKQLLSQGWAVMALDLRGHGASKTKNQTAITATEQWRVSSHEFPQDLDPALDWLKAQARIDTGKIVVIGYDIGANLALIASGRFPEVRTVVALKPNLTESLAMAGSAQDFQPRSALIVASNQADGEAIKQHVQAPVQVRVATVTGGASQWLQDTTLTNAVFQWLKETF